MAEMKGSLSFPAAHQKLVTHDGFLTAVKSHVDAKFAMNRDMSPESQVHTLASCRIEPLALPKCAAESRASMLILVQVGNIFRAPPRTLPRTRRGSGDAAFLKAGKLALVARSAKHLGSKVSRGNRLVQK